MAWFLLARLLFVIAVVYSAVLLRPLGGSVAAQRRLRRGAGRGVCRLRVAAQEHLGHAHARRDAGRRHRPGHRQDRRRGALLGRHQGRPRRVPPLLRAARPAVPRAGAGRPQGRVARAGAPDRAVPRHRPAAPLPHPRHQRDHRRPRRRHLRDRVSRRHARDPAVRAQGTAAGRRLVGLDEAQPRPARARHPAEDAEDVGAST